MVDVVVKQTSEPKPTEPKTEKAESPKEVDKAQEEKKVEKESLEVESEKPKETEAKPEPEESPEKKEVKSKPAAAAAPKRSNKIEELSAQIGDSKEKEEAETPPKSDTLKAFDTKQYHIPIKPSHHHRAGSSFMVFAAVLAGILAVVFVLNELEIIDLAALVYTN